MIVQCTNCRARFRVADEKVPERGVKVRCTKCATVFRVTRADAVESTGRQTTSRDAYGLGEPTPSPAPRPSPSDFDLGLDLGGPPPPATPRQGQTGHLGERTTAPAPARSAIRNLPRAPSAIDAAFDAALASGTDPFADLGFEAPAPTLPQTPAPPRPDPFADEGFASNDPFAELAAQSQPGAASFDDDPFAAAAQPDPFAAAAARQLTDPFAAPAAATADPFADAGLTSDPPPHDPFGELPPAQSTTEPSPEPTSFSDLDEAPVEKLAPRGGMQEFDFSESTLGGPLDLNLAAVGIDEPAPARTQVGQLNLAAKVADRPVTSRQRKGRSFGRDLASALFNVASASIVGLAALVAIASLRSPRALTVDDLGFDLVWIAMGYTQPAADKGDLQAVNVSSGTYLTWSGQELFYVRGEVENSSAAQRPAVHVAIDVVRSGNLLGRAEAIGHLAAGPEDLFALDSRDNDALQRQLATKTTSLSLPPRSRANFLAVFPLGGQQVDGAELKLSVLDGVPPTLADTVGALRPEPQAPPSDTAGEPEQK